MNGCFTNAMRMYLDGENQGNGQSAYKLSCEMRKNGFNELIVQNHCNKAAMWNYGPAQVELGIAAMFGNLIDFERSVVDDVYYQDSNVAVDWFKKASSNKNPMGEYLYAKCLQLGLFGLQKEEKANEMLFKVVEKLSMDNVVMLNYIVDLFMNGESALPNPANAVALDMPKKFFALWNDEQIYKKAS